MTMRTYHLVVCNCGHEGKIKLSENDQPYSSFWQSYSLHDLEGRSFSPTSHVGWENVFKQMNISCPICSNRLTKTNLVNE